MGSSGATVQRIQTCGGNLSLLPVRVYGTVWSMSTKRLTPTSYLILGLLAREGPATAYELERHVAATLGQFWSFARTLLYSEPGRLAEQGLVIETREAGGRRRRVFEITDAGMAALTTWLDQPSSEPTELRDLGLLQLFFTDLAPHEARLRLAQQQLSIHNAKLLAYQQEERGERHPRPDRKGQRTVAHWRGETLRMGLLYEAAAVEFWSAAIAKGGRAEGSEVS
jgi:PadR family transcriptional regulator AphA